jgi:beta-glucosidase
MAAALIFPDDFVWGSATSAYQIEGAHDVDGKGPSIWDIFSHQPRKTFLGQTGDVAADHYHRYRDDIQIMRRLELKAYRFSISWSRVMPAGRGAVNPAGLDFYDRLIDGLLENGIQPVATLFHYDLPQPLQESGGWPNRDTAYAFQDYAEVLSKRYSDRVTYWITHNEPFVTASAGYLTGEHAPGIRDVGATLSSAHTLLLSHGLAAQAIRSNSTRTLQVGIALNLTPVHPATDSEDDWKAARRYDSLLNRTTLDPIFCQKYPEEVLDLLGFMFPTIQEGDMQIISTPIDFLGINYYTRAIVQHDPNVPFIEFTEVRPPDSSYSQMWEIYPAGIYELVKRIWNDYRPNKIFITENGVCVPDGIDFDGKVRDNRRIQYLQDHLIQVHRAIEEGIPVMGYLVWSLMDNFEWALGYQKRFGLVHIDFETLSRTVKNSGIWFRDVIKKNGFIPEEFFREYQD